MMGERMFKLGEMVKVRITGELGMVIEIYGEIYTKVYKPEKFTVRLTDCSTVEFYGFELDHRDSENHSSHY